MEVILLEDVPHLGVAGSLTKVKPGYARNLLFPKGWAVKADVKHKRQLAHQQSIATHRRKKLEAAHKEMATRLDGMVLTLPRKAGEQGKLFGSVTTQDLQTALAVRNVEVDRRCLEISEPFRQVGEYDAVVRLSNTLKVPIKVMVVAES